MIKTVVCHKEGCCGNEFYIKTINNSLEVTCRECNNKYLFDVSNYDFVILSNCSRCNNNIFKLFHDNEKNQIYARCTECGEPPEKIFLDEDGIQVSYESKLLEEIKMTMSLVEQRMCNLEMKLESLEKSQDVIEESLAYINKYIVVQDN